MKVCTYHTAEEVIKRAIKEVGKENIKPTTLKIMNKCLKLCKTKYGFENNLDFELCNMFVDNMICDLSEIVDIFDDLPDEIKELIGE
jgi:hypothetical protein